MRLDGKGGDEKRPGDLLVGASRDYQGRPACTRLGTCSTGCPERAMGSFANTHWPIALRHGAVLITGARAPVLVTAAMVATMKEGAVIVDVAVDQGGSVETIKQTTLLDPTLHNAALRDR